MGRASVAALAAAIVLSSTGCASTPEATIEPVQIGPLVRPGVPLDLARHRSATISNVAYHLALDLTDDQWVHGDVSIFLERSPEAGHLVLDFRGLSVTELYANQERVSDAAWVNGHIVVAEEHLVDGPNTIDVRFMSPVAPSGASVIRFAEPADSASGGEPDTYHYSLLVPADASQLFPSFDQPDLKAVFSLELIVPEGTIALANAPLADSVTTARGLWTRFEPTRPISTYLAAFAAGPWATWTDSSASVPMTLYARRSRASEVEADTLLERNRRALEWLEEYFAYEYPFTKLDLLLAPAFPFGGMEHPGAIFYNESRFIFREEPTLPERLARDATIYHEVAHQWFGDLVTMEWFDDLWLKEGFATYMAAKMQEALNPGTGAWKTFYLENKPPAYRVDATTGTTPVWQALANLDEAKSNYGPIVYNKAPAILKQLNFLIGEEAFRTGLQRLLREYDFDTFTWRDLLNQMERASGVPLDRFSEQYVLRAGVPVIETELEVRGGQVQSLRLVQRPAAELRDSVTGWWPGRIQVRLGYANGEDRLIPVEFAGDTTTVPGVQGLPVPDYVFSNDGDYGYGIFLLDQRSAEHLSEAVGTLEEDLLRALVWGALWEGVREGRLPPERFVQIALRELPREQDQQIAGFVLGRTSLALDRYLAGGPAERLRRAFEEVLIQGLADETESYGLRKGHLDALLANARSEDALAYLEDLLARRRLFQGSPLPQPSRWAAVRTLLATGHPSADSIFAAERRRDATPEGARQAFIAGAANPEAASKEEYFRRYLEDTSLNEEWVTASLPVFNHPAQRGLTISFLDDALDRLVWIRENRRIFFLPQWIESFVASRAGERALATVDEYLTSTPDLPEDIRLKLLQARDELARTVRIRAAPTGPGL